LLCASGVMAVNSSDSCSDCLSCSALGQCREFSNRIRCMIIFEQFCTQGFFGPWSGVIFRSVSPRYARAPDVVSGDGSFHARAAAGMRQVRTRFVEASTITVSCSSVSGDLGVPGVTVPPTHLTTLPAKKPDKPRGTHGVPDF
jgi:hypothetical protein